MKYLLCCCCCFFLSDSPNTASFAIQHSCCRDWVCTSLVWFFPSYSMIFSLFSCILTFPGQRLRWTHQFISPPTEQSFHSFVWCVSLKGSRRFQAGDNRRSCLQPLAFALFSPALRGRMGPQDPRAAFGVFVLRLFAWTGSLDYILLFPLKPMHVV